MVETGSQGILDCSYLPPGMKQFQFLNNWYSHTSEYQPNISLPIGKSEVILSIPLHKSIMALLEAEGFLLAKIPFPLDI